MRAFKKPEPLWTEKKPATIKTPASYLIVKDTQIDKNNYSGVSILFFRIVLKLAYARFRFRNSLQAPFPRNFFAVWVHASSTSSDERASGLTCVASLNLLFTSREQKISIDLQIVVPSS